MSYCKGEMSIDKAANASVMIGTEHSSLSELHGKATMRSVDCHSARDVMTRDSWVCVDNLIFIYCGAIVVGDEAIPISQ